MDKSCRTIAFSSKYLHMDTPSVKYRELDVSFVIAKEE
jgi:hypothetical protein